MSSVDVVAVEVVVEDLAECPDRARAEALLADALANARAPRSGSSPRRWSLTLTVEGEGGTKAATASIVDGRGRRVAERTVSDARAHGCTPLARALGAWASLVLDDEMARAHDEAPAPPSPEEGAAPKSSSPAGLELGISGPGSTAGDRVEAPDADGAAGASRRTLEVGLLGYVRGGLVSTAGFAGATPFVNLEVSPGWFVRPAVSFGTSTSAVPLGGAERGVVAHVGVRSDVCRRFPGNYIARHGMELDLCVGADLSEVYAYGVTAGSDAHPTILRPSAGPSAVLRGELGESTNVELRGVGGYSFRRAALVAEDPLPPIYAAVELGMSWRFR